MILKININNLINNKNINQISNIYIYYIFSYYLFYCINYLLIVYPAMTKYFNQNPEVLKSGYDDFEGKNIPCLEVNIK